MIVVCVTLAGRMFQRISSSFRETNASRPATSASAVIHWPTTTKYARLVTNHATYASTRTQESASTAPYLNSPSDSPRLIAATHNAALDFSSRPTRLAHFANLHVWVASGLNRTAQSAILNPQRQIFTTTSALKLAQVDSLLLVAFARSVSLPALNAVDYQTTALLAMERTKKS